jgi:hypothetical protein
MPRPVNPSISKQSAKISRSAPSAAVRRSPLHRLLFALTVWLRWQELGEMRAIDLESLTRDD